MPRYTAADKPDHDAARRTAVLLIQLGTPSAPEPAAVRRYLAEFLADPRVVEIPKTLWGPILHGVILRIRPRSSAQKYAAIWTREGSPLAVNTVRQARLLRGWLGEDGHAVEVEYAMRYGEPSIPKVLRALRDRGVGRLLLLPLYPQYAASTTATAVDAVFRELAGWRDQPEVRTVRSFHDRPEYIDALANQIRAGWQADGPPDRLLMSFHGLPRRSVELGDPYQHECLVTGRMLGARLGLRDADYTITFQSRFGRAQWLTPYTAATLAELGHQKVRRVDVVCPGFVSDCLETLEEIAIEGKQTFIEAGGRGLRHHPCLNDGPGLIRCLTALARDNLAGWPTARPAADKAARRA